MSDADTRRKSLTLTAIKAAGQKKGISVEPTKFKSEYEIKFISNGIVIGYFMANTHKLDLDPLTTAINTRKVAIFLDWVTFYCRITRRQNPKYEA